jgi:hypothetical protein
MKPGKGRRRIDLDIAKWGYDLSFWVKASHNARASQGSEPGESTRAENVNSPDRVRAACRL